MAAVVLVFSGEYDLDCWRRMRAELDAIATGQSVFLDFTGVTYVDTSILTELICFQKLRKMAVLQPASLIVDSESGVGRLLDIIDANLIFPIVGSMTEALPAGAVADVRYAFTVDTSARSATDRAPEAPFGGWLPVAEN